MSDGDGKVMIVSLGQLASVPGMPSEPTLRKLITDNPDFPVISRGKNGQAYELDLGASIRFIQGLETARKERERIEAAEIKQFGLALLGTDAAADLERVGLSASERRAFLEEELFAIKLGEARGNYVRKASVEMAISAVFHLLAQRSKDFSARLGKRIELSREQINQIDQFMARDLQELATKFEELADVGDVSPDVAADPPV